MNTTDPSLRKKKIVAALKVNKFENLKGSQDLIEKIRVQRQAFEVVTKYEQTMCFENQQEIETDQQLKQLLVTQHHVLTQLDEENVRLITENQNYQRQLMAMRTERDLINYENNKLRLENRQNRKSNKSSRNEGDRQSVDLRNQEGEILVMSIKIQKLKNKLLECQKKH